MNILLTGATGFIGSAVVAKLTNNKKHNVIALSSRSIDGIKTVLHNNYNFDKQYLESQGCENVELIVHLGAFTPKSSTTADDLNLSFSNIANTKVLLQSYLPNLKRLIYISSIDVYSGNEIFSEKTIPNPISLYGQSKLYCENMVKCFAKERDLSYTVLRIGHVFGPGEESYNKVIPNTIRNIISGKTVKIYNGGKDRRSFIYIDDVVTSITNAIEYNGNEPIINVTGNEIHSIMDIINILEILSNKNISKEYIETGAVSRDVVFDNSLLKKELFSNFTSIKEGLKQEYIHMQGLYE